MQTRQHASPWTAPEPLASPLRRVWPRAPNQSRSESRAWGCGGAEAAARTLPPWPSWGEEESPSPSPSGIWRASAAHGAARLLAGATPRATFVPSLHVAGQRRASWNHRTCKRAASPSPGGGSWRWRLMASAHSHEARAPRPRSQKQASMAPLLWPPQKQLLLLPSWASLRPPHQSPTRGSAGARASEPLACHCAPSRSLPSRTGWQMEQSGALPQAPYCSRLCRQPAAQGRPPPLLSPWGVPPVPCWSLPWLAPPPLLAFLPQAPPLRARCPPGLAPLSSPRPPLPPSSPARPSHAPPSPSGASRAAPSRAAGPSGPPSSRPPPPPLPLPLHPHSPVQQHHPPPSPSPCCSSPPCCRSDGTPPPPGHSSPPRCLSPHCPLSPRPPPYPAASGCFLYQHRHRRRRRCRRRCWQGAAAELQPQLPSLAPLPSPEMPPRCRHPRPSCGRALSPLARSPPPCASGRGHSLEEGGSFLLPSPPPSGSGPSPKETLPLLQSPVGSTGPWLRQASASSCRPSLYLCPAWGSDAYAPCRTLCHAQQPCLRSRGRTTGTSGAPAALGEATTANECGGGAYTHPPAGGCDGAGGRAHSEGGGATLGTGSETSGAGGGKWTATSSAASAQAGATQTSSAGAESARGSGSVEGGSGWATGSGTSGSCAPSLADAALRCCNGQGTRDEPSPLEPETATASAKGSARAATASASATWVRAPLGSGRRCQLPLPPEGRSQKMLLLRPLPGAC